MIWGGKKPYFWKHPYHNNQLSNGCWIFQMFATKLLLTWHHWRIICLLWPCICLKHADLMNYATRGTMVRISHVLLLQLIAECHVCKHRSQLLNGLLSTFHLQLCDETILSIIGDWELVQQAPWQRALVDVKENVFVFPDSSKLSMQHTKILFEMVAFVFFCSNVSS